MRILLVDDDELLLRLLAGNLRRAGYVVDTAGDGRRGLDLYLAHAHDLIVTDWQMPVMEGIELCRHVRAADAAGGTYIIMLTGQRLEEQKIDGLYAGADEYVTKPVKLSHLMASIRTAERILSTR